MIRPEDQQRLQPCLLPGERLLWAGRPRRGLIFRDSDLFNVALALFAAGAVLIWQVADESEDHSPSSWWVAFAIVMALYGVFGRFFHEAWLRAGLLYAVSDRRVIVLGTRFRRRSCSLDIGYLPTALLERDGDLGTLRFELGETETDPLFRNGFGKWNPSGSDLLSFEQIEHPQMVCNLIARESDRLRRELGAAAVPDPIFNR